MVLKHFFSNAPPVKKLFSIKNPFFLAHIILGTFFFGLLDNIWDEMFVFGAFVFGRHFFLFVLEMFQMQSTPRCTLTPI